MLRYALAGTIATLVFSAAGAQTAPLNLEKIMADPDWNNGNYYGGQLPGRGLAVARMVGHITYMSDESMREKVGRKLRTPDQVEVESYLK